MLAVSPVSATFSKAAASDVVLTVSGNKTFTVTGLKIAGTAVNADNYTISGSAVTIKSAYLSGLANGDKAFKVLATSGTEEFELAATVTVGD